MTDTDRLIQALQALAAELIEIRNLLYLILDALTAEWPDPAQAVSNALVKVWKRQQLGLGWEGDDEP